jgi:hypothetical protein
MERECRRKDVNDKIRKPPKEQPYITKGSIPVIQDRPIEPIVFILRAGFNVDVFSEAGCQNGLPVSGLPARYPVVRDLLNICFNMDELPLNKSIEDLFQKSIDAGEKRPLGTLYNYLMELDYYIIYPITPHIRLGGKHYNNAYIRFLRDFQKASLITFNYDSIPEILLCFERLWSPRDGYGVPVQARERRIRKGPPPIRNSPRTVLHLHGSLCVYIEDFSIEKQPGSWYPILQECEPKFLFDPDKLEQCFSPFLRILPSITSYTHPFNRIIAPIPNKAEGLKNEFIKAVYDKAIEILNNANQIVVIGYSFNPYDNESYNNLLVTMANKAVLLIAPDAIMLKERLAQEYPKIEWEAQSMRFKEWVDNDYPGVRK